jgi:ABC-2 type transport system permease protein
VTIFLRDASQWSQLVLLLALVVIYVYNFSGPSGRGRDAARRRPARRRRLLQPRPRRLRHRRRSPSAFVYPVVSLEGRSWWLLRTAPVALGSIWWSKFWIGFLPLVFLGELLVPRRTIFSASTWP